MKLPRSARAPRGATAVLGALLVAVSASRLPAQGCPGAVESLIAGGWEAYRSERLERADTLFRRALVRCPRDLAARTGVGYTTLRLGRAEERVPGAALGGLGDQVVVLRRHARVGNLKCVEDPQLDESGKLRQRTRHAEEFDHPLITELHQELNQSLALQRFRVTAGELEHVHVLGDGVPVVP